MTDEEALEVIKSAEIGDFITGVPTRDGHGQVFVSTIVLRLEDGWLDITNPRLIDHRFKDEEIALLNTEKYIWSLS